jgi:formiminotetrahydrofolate cyclodeaminase
MSSSYLEHSVESFLDALAAGTPAPAGGSAAGLAVAQSAALCTMTAQLSRRMLSAVRADQLVLDTERIRRTAASLVDLDAEAYSRVINASRAAKLGAQATTAHTETVAEAMSHAADVPLRIVELAVEVAKLARVLARDGNPALRGDAATAGLLAHAGGQAAATLVRINLASAPDDARLARLEALLAEMPDPD